MKSLVPAGLHRIRVEFPEYETLARQIEVRAGASATIYATLTRRAQPQPAANATSPAFLAFSVVTVALVAVVVWMMLRRPEERSAIYTATPRPGSGRGLSPAPTPPGDLNPGATEDDHGQQWFGDYRLHEILGRGGMASVYKAEKGGELSALKRPLGSLLGDADFVERFLREADIGRTLNHPNIVRILGRGDVEGVPYFTMELLTGQNVQAFIREWGAAEPRAAAEVVVQVAEALDFAHGKGVIHRDLKPSNIMLLQDGTAKVLDFGIARARRFEGITVTGAFLGTPDYVAPEVIEGHGAEPRSDLYSLGALFYELLTGQRLFTGETAFAILKKHCVEEPRQASTVRPGIPAELDAVLAQLLAKSPRRPPVERRGAGRDAPRLAQPRGLTSRRRGRSPVVAPPDRSRSFSTSSRGRSRSRRGASRRLRKGFRTSVGRTFSRYSRAVPRSSTSGPRIARAAMRSGSRSRTRDRRRNTCARVRSSLASLIEPPPVAAPEPLSSRRTVAKTTSAGTRRSGARASSAARAPAHAARTGSSGSSRPRSSPSAAHRLGAAFSTRGSRRRTTTSVAGSRIESRICPVERAARPRRARSTSRWMSVLATRGRRWGTRAGFECLGASQHRADAIDVVGAKVGDLSKDRVRERRGRPGKTSGRGTGREGPARPRELRQGEPRARVHDVLGIEANLAGAQPRLERRDVAPVESPCRGQGDEREPARDEQQRAVGSVQEPDSRQGEAAADERPQLVEDDVDDLLRRALVSLGHRRVEQLVPRAEEGVRQHVVSPPAQGRGPEPEVDQPQHRRDGDGHRTQRDGSRQAQPRERGPRQDQLEPEGQEPHGGVEGGEERHHLSAGSQGG